MDQISISAKQIHNTLQFIDRTQSEAVKRSIFSELGCQCFQATGVADFLDQFRGRPEAYLSRVNDAHAIQYWESILPGEDGNSYILTGTVAGRCVCSFADHGEAPMALCDYCCKKFQERLFSTLFGRAVEVEMTSSCLKGGDRCSTIIHFR